MPSLIPLFLATFLALQLIGCATMQKSADDDRRGSKLSRNDRGAPIPRPHVRLANFEDNQTTLATYKVLRHVSMFYKLDLMRDNDLSTAVADIMRTQEDKIRECYIGRLEDKPKLRGQVALSFAISKETGGIRRIAQIGGNLTDKPLLTCISKELAQLPLNPPKSLRGRLLYSFDVVESVAQAK